ncbi:hypersensitive-induced reaction 1 protein-like [Rhodamnia argentea]|uniref:Hypersensitive-induced reaction 1 protein-like n=1 Tax=Rhodamnia argentea TaxID=178133 RepID=A0A8B8QE61_9MYRT|nr:hypersensitive-induced reaction 1 protein-like [Rhodamnia argentea]
MGNRCCCIQVNRSTVAVKERFGKFDEVLQPGCHFVPRILGYKIAGHLSLRSYQLDVKCETKTKGNVFVTVIASVQYRVVADKPEDAIYKLSNPINQIRAYVIGAIVASIGKMDLDEAFEKMNEISEAVEDELAQVMLANGCEIVKTLIINIIPDERAKQAISELNAEIRLYLVLKIYFKVYFDRRSYLSLLKVLFLFWTVVAAILSGMGTANQHQAVVDALRNGVIGFSESVPGTTVKDIMDMALTTQYLDSIKE